MKELAKKKILVTGGAGFLGTHVVEELILRGAAPENITVPRSAEYDLRRKEVCEKLVVGKDLVIHLAAKVGGIGFNQAKPGELFFDNLAMGVYITEAALRAGVEKLLLLGTICAYPKFTPVPFHEDDLWNGYPEETNAPYGLAKKSLLIQAQGYRHQYGMNIIFLLPVNLYGPGDTFDPARSHVIPAMIRKFEEARTEGRQVVEMWGTGRATREFLYVADAARGIVDAVQGYDEDQPVNLGSGKEISIRELAGVISGLTGYSGEIRWDDTKPDGQPRRMLDTSKAKEKFGFEASTPLDEGLKNAIEWYRNNRGK